LPIAYFVILPNSTLYPFVNWVKIDIGQFTRDSHMAVHPHTTQSG